MAAESTSFVPDRWTTMPADLWSFTLDFYARPGVEQACLRLQDEGADVCLLLCGVWLGKRGVACTPRRVDALVALAGPWQADVVTPLRGLRRQWHTAAQQDSALADLREQLKTLELQAERQLLARLQQLTREWPIDEATNVQDWLRTLCGPQACQEHDALQRLCAALEHAGGQA